MLECCFYPAVYPLDNAKTKSYASGKSFLSWQGIATPSPCVTASAATYFSFFDVISNIAFASGCCGAVNKVYPVHEAVRCWLLPIRFKARSVLRKLFWCCTLFGIGIWCLQLGLPSAQVYRLSDLGKSARVVHGVSSTAWTCWLFKGIRRLMMRSAWIQHNAWSKTLKLSGIIADNAQGDGNTWANRPPIKAAFVMILRCCLVCDALLIQPFLPSSAVSIRTTLSAGSANGRLQITSPEIQAQDVLTDYAAVFVVPYTRRRRHSVHKIVAALA